MELDSSAFFDTGGFDSGSAFHDTVHAELPSAENYPTMQSVLSTGAANSSDGLAGLDAFVNRGFATADGLLKAWGGVENLKLKTEALKVQTAAAKGDMEIARAQNDARQAQELARAEQALYAARAAQEAAKNGGVYVPTAGIPVGNILALGAAAFVIAKLFSRGRK